MPKSPLSSATPGLNRLGKLRQRHLYQHHKLKDPYMYLPCPQFKVVSGRQTRVFGLLHLVVEEAEDEGFTDIVLEAKVAFIIH